MARGRMVNSKIVLNRAVNDLSDDTSRLAFTWLITFADVEGRTYGDPAVVRSMLFPRRTDVTVEQVERYIREWAAAGLVQWYEAEGDLWIAFPSFERNQRGLDRRKEPVSCIPAPDSSVPGTYQVRTEYVPSTAEQNRTELQLEQNGTVGAMPETASAPAPEAPTASPAEPAKRADRRSDPRSAHPAIQAARAATGARKYPPFELYDAIIAALGESPDCERLDRCRQAWVTRGYNPNAWTWATEWYAQGVPERARGPTPATVPRADGRPTGAAARRAWAERGNNGSGE